MGLTPDPLAIVGAPAATGAGRAALQDAMVRIDAAHEERREEASPAVDLWSSLVSGRWSLIEHFERDGRHYFLAHRNDPEVAKLRALTSAEMQVWCCAAMGQSNERIAYALGISVATVAGRLRHVRRKLGADVSLEAMVHLYAETDGACIPPTK
jgi:DNA-binding CsgD family transcriptional regulator